MGQAMISGLAACVIATSCGTQPARVVTPQPDARILYVATNGDDRWSGTLAAPNASRTDGPFASIQRAQGAARDIATSSQRRRAVTVEIRGGTYEIRTPLVFTAEDSGTRDNPTVYRGAAGEHVRISGGQTVRLTPVRNEPAKSRLDPQARGHVLRTDLRAAGISEYGSALGGGLELFFRDRPMALARWPNIGFERIGDTRPGVDRELVYTGERPRRWLAEPDIWLHGHWFWDWADERQKVQRIDPQLHTIQLEPPAHRYGYKRGQVYYAYNILAELDTPGEWYLDREAGVLYFWPPVEGDRIDAAVSLAPALLQIRGASHLTFQGLTFEAARGDAATIEGGERVAIVGSVVRNVGGWAIKVLGGADHQVRGCRVSDTGEGGIWLEGGDRMTLRRANHVASFNDIHDFARWNRTARPGIEIVGVGIRVANNAIHDAPHEGIEFSGNDHVIELNEIHHVCEETNDAAAIYAGRDWTMRGTTVRHNYIHNVRGFEQRGAYGICLDDMFSGTTIEGNVLFDVALGVLVGGGRDNVVSDNIFVQSDVAVRIDNRGLTWAAPSIDSFMKPRLASVPYASESWRGRYPELARILEDRPGAPLGNTVARNVVWNGRLDDMDPEVKRLVRVDANLVGIDPQLFDNGRMNPKIPDSSPIAHLPASDIPLRAIGVGAKGPP